MQPSCSVIFEFGGLTVIFGLSSHLPFELNLTFKDQTTIKGFFAMARAFVAGRTSP